MKRRPPRSKRTDTLFPYTTLFGSVSNIATAILAAAEPSSSAIRLCSVSPITSRRPRGEAGPDPCLAERREIGASAMICLFGLSVTPVASMQSGACAARDRGLAPAERGLIERKCCRCWQSPTDPHGQPETRATGRTLGERGGRTPKHG